MRIWDCFLCEGSKVLFRFAIGIIKINEKNINQLGGSTAIFNYMKNMTQRLHDVNELVKVSFAGINPFPSKAIKLGREKHLGILREEMREMEEHRQENEAALRRIRAASNRKMETSE